VKYLIIIAILFGFILVAGLAYIQQPKFGPKIDTSEFKAEHASPHFVNGSFQNLEPTPVLLGDKSTFSIMMDGFRNRAENLRPDFRLPTQKTDLKSLDTNRDLVIWLGHSSYYVQLGGRRILIDPVFSQHAAPVPFGDGAYEGTSIYSADDIPDIDYLFAKIAEKFEGFDLVVLDMGQYDKRWRYIHMTPEEAATAAEELHARALLPAHVGKFTIANHPWNEPFERIIKASEGKRYRLVTPKIGESFELANESQTFDYWWRQIAVDK
jgi:hypothetical protein